MPEMPVVCLSFVLLFTIFIIVVTQKLVLQQSKNVTEKCTETLSPTPSIQYLLGVKRIVWKFVLSKVIMDKIYINKSIFQGILCASSKQIKLFILSLIHILPAVHDREFFGILKFRILSQNFHRVNHKTYTGLITSDDLKHLKYVDLSIWICRSVDLKMEFGLLSGVNILCITIVMIRHKFIFAKHLE